jgi:4-hydroxyacetophenone monooxygenase
VAGVTLRWRGVEEARLRLALAEAHLPTLLPAVAALTGDLTLLAPALLPEQPNLLAPQNGMSAQQCELAREAVVSAMRAFDHKAVAPPPPGRSELQAMLNFAAGGRELPGYLPLLEEELDVAGADLRMPRWHKSQLAPDRDFRVVIIGAGMSGILAARRLQQAGVPFVILEKNAELGGTWNENAYPGCRVDVPSHLYSYTFAQDEDWRDQFSTRAALMDYFRSCVREFGLSDQIKFGVEVLEASWDDAALNWRLRTRDATGAESSYDAHAIISAVGQLNRPQIPAIDGASQFAGQAFHSARWPADMDFKGLRVGIIGTGASTAQFAPFVAEEAASTCIFQRTPSWSMRTPELHDQMPDEQRWLFDLVPGYRRWFRFGQFLSLAEGLLPLAKIDPSWPSTDKSVSAANEMLRQRLAKYVERSLSGRPDLIAACIPDYPPTAKRMVRDNGAWLATLRRDDVVLETDAIDRIDEGGIWTRTGTYHPLDVIIYGTGFRASDFLMPMSVSGREGVSIHERWNGDARALHGVTVPDMPNLFLLYGPNTNLVVNGSATFLSECEMTYILGCIELLLRSGAGAMTCQLAAHDAYNRRVDEGNQQMAWGLPSVDSWYKSRSGRVSQNWPFSLLDFWTQLRAPAEDDYILFGNSQS